MIQYFNYNIKNKTTFKIDTSVKEWISFENQDELQTFIRQRSLKEELHFVMGGGSNVLFVKDYDGLIIHLDFQEIDFLEETQNYVYVKVGAGVIWDKFVQYCVEKDYWGVENLSLIPGTVGASPVQNIGAYGVEAQDVIFDVRAVNKQTGELRIFSYEECQFDYRDSFFKKETRQEWIVSEVVFRLAKDPLYHLSYGPLAERFKDKKPSLREIRDAIIEIRESKLPDPEEIGNAGSFFKNPIVDIEVNNRLMQDYPQMPYYLVDIDKAKLAAAWLIEQAGWKAYSDGEVGVYDKQALVLINKGNAKGEDVFRLSEKIIDSVKEQFSVILEREVIVI